MQSLEKRVSMLEGARAMVNLKTMTDAELNAYAGTCEYGSKEMYVALVTLVNRHPSTIPVIKDDPDLAVIDEKT